MSPRRRLLLVLLISSSVLTGCAWPFTRGADAPGAATPPVSAHRLDGTPGPTSPAPTRPAPTTAPPAPPAGYDGDGADGAAAAATYLLEVIDYAMTTGDTAPLMSVSAPDCLFCTSALADVRRLAEAGTRVDQVHTVTGSQVGRQVDGSYVVDLTTTRTVTTEQTTSSGGLEIELGPTTTVVYGIQVVRVDGGWRVVGARLR